MKNLNNEENSDFEKSWKDAFEGAELEPSEDVWLKIDGVLANKEAKGFKKTIIYYKYAAAVSLVLLLSTAVVSYYLLNGNEVTTQRVANKDDANIESIVTHDSGNSSNSQNSSEKKGIYSSNDPEKSDVIAENRYSKNNTNEESEGNVNGTISNNKQLGIKDYNETERDRSNGVNVNDKNEAGRKTDPKYNNNVEKHRDYVNQTFISQNEAVDNKAFDSVIHNNEEQFTRSSTSYVALSPLNPKSHETLAFARKEIQNEIYRVPVVRNKKDRKDEDASSKGYFAGLQISPGYFDPNIQMNSNGLFTANSFFDSDRSVKISPALASQYNAVEAQPQVSYTYGLNFGFKVARRWLINMGLQYSRNNTSGTTTYVVDNNKRYLATPSTLNNFSNDAADYTESVNYSLPIMGYQPYLEVYEFTSLPVKAGYVIVDKKLTWIISTGIATDFFLQSRSHDPSGNSDDQSIKSGESSNFKKVFFNGLGSSEVIYNINKNYSISIEPSFRAAISSFSKTDSQFSSHPKAFGIAAGFRYNF